jgi:hypothetical protein
MEFQCYQMAGGRVRSGFGGSGHGVVGSPAVGDKHKGEKASSAADILAIACTFSCYVKYLFSPSP